MTNPSGYVPLINEDVISALKTLAAAWVLIHGMHGGPPCHKQPVCVRQMHKCCQQRVGCVPADVWQCMGDAVDCDIRSSRKSQADSLQDSFICFFVYLTRIETRVE